MTTQRKNHPKKGSILTVEPIRSPVDVATVCEYARQNKRNLTMFTLGVNSSLRAGELLSLTMGDIDWFWGKIIVHDKQTGKKRDINLPPEMLVMLAAYRNPDSVYDQDELLFPSAKGGGQISTSTFNNMVKKWCEDCGLKGNFGSNTLRKTWAYIQYTVFQIDLAVISQYLGHPDVNTTCAYLGVVPNHVRMAHSNFIGLPLPPTNTP